jgi:hypothetical protein
MACVQCRFEAGLAKATPDLSSRTFKAKKVIGRWRDGSWFRGANEIQSQIDLAPVRNSTLQPTDGSRFVIGVNLKSILVIVTGQLLSDNLNQSQPYDFEANRPATASR